MGSGRTGARAGEEVFISARVCEGGRLNKGARVAWVLFEMRTLSKAASEKRPDETRKDTSAPGTRVSRREKRETSKKNAGCLRPRAASFPRSRRQTSGPRKAFCFTHRNFPVGASSAPSFLCAAEMLTGAQQCYREIPVTADDIFFQPYNRPDYFICMAEHEAGETTVFLLNKSEIVLMLPRVLVRYSLRGSHSAA